MKTCSKCKREKSNSKFYARRDRKYGLSVFCKVCERKRRLLGYRDKKEAINFLKRLYCNENKINWVEYFKKRYGEVPQCQICGKTLVWAGLGKINEVVHFDHKSKDLLISKSPMQWAADRPCTPETISIWESCNFGILCNVCNSRLLTEGRKRWLENALKYCLNY